ncbi:hypothetical protein SteCoe_3480 [Stentor coeruleus]|uniref:Protein kinase domain-containing protein n=1 Tax=Stentor coeruleus TaxID=5963 RepID=A0A1R2CWX6_9CILI|nr:hypothetical protein SteCoe_3480 [Stentor coeruleus]
MENSSQKKVKIIGHYILGKSIGEGTFGKVKLGTHTLTEEKVAVKILEKERIKDVSDVERVAREIHILKLIRHPNIIQLYEIIETPKHLFLIMEYASGGELFDYIVAKSRLEEIEACRFFQQIISGVEYIHKLGVVHRDLKPENLLLDANNNIKIVDFGLSNTYKHSELLQTACGSPCYAAPEMIAGNKYDGLKVDLWSCGVILFAMISGYLPFEDPNTAELYKKILNCDYETPDWVSSLTKDMMSCILNTDPSTRYTIPQIRQHSWFKQVFSESSLGILIGYNPIPINQEILKKLTDYNFDLEHSQKCIEANKHNHITTTYYLLMKKHKASPGIVEISSEKSIAPKPPIMAYAPIMASKPNFRHRKYIEKKIESTGGSYFQENEIPKKPISPKRAITPNTSNGLKANHPIVKQTRGRRYVSAGRHIPKEPSYPKNSQSRPTRIKIKKIITIKSKSNRRVNKSADLKMSEMKTSFKSSPKFRDYSFSFNKIR